MIISRRNLLASSSCLALLYFTRPTHAALVNKEKSRSGASNSRTQNRRTTGAVRTTLDRDGPREKSTRSDQARPLASPRLKSERSARSSRATQEGKTAENTQDLRRPGFNKNMTRPGIRSKDKVKSSPLAQGMQGISTATSVKGAAIDFSKYASSKTVTAPKSQLKAINYFGKTVAAVGLIADLVQIENTEIADMSKPERRALAVGKALVGTALPLVGAATSVADVTVSAQETTDKNSVELGYTATRDWLRDQGGSAVKSFHDELFFQGSWQNDLFD